MCWTIVIVAFNITSVAPVIALASVYLCFVLIIVDRLSSALSLLVEQASAMILPFAIHYCSKVSKLLLHIILLSMSVTILIVTANQ
jgi:hypothetical protein